MTDQGDIEESCSRCQDSPNKRLITQLDSLKQKLIDKNITIIQMEAKMSQNMPHTYAQGQLATLRATCDSWQDKYERLFEAHKRLQKVNQGLEDKLLRLVDRSESEKARLSQDTTNLTTALTTAAQAINRLKNENTRYQKDLSLAIQLLQCNPSHYASHKLDILPSELHQKVRSRLAPEPPKPTKTEAKVIRVPIPTFPPTAMVYSVNKCSEEKKEEEPVDVVSAAILAAILEERERERSQRHCPTCTCQDIGEKGLPLQQSGTDGSPERSPDRFSNSKHARKDPRSEESFTRGRDSSQSAISASFDVRAIDIGTQTLPSYIGETGKVTSTCIYCHSVKNLSDINVQEENPPVIPSSQPSFAKKCSPGISSLKNCSGQHRKMEDKRSPNGNGVCPWDWHAESHDSGSPSTPTSLTSTSLSYESEASCFASPQDSPGHVSLHSMNGLIKAPEGRPGVDSADEGRGSIPEETPPTQVKMVIPCPTVNNGLVVLPNTSLAKEARETEKSCRRGRPIRDISDRDPIYPHRTASIPFHAPDNFTPIHISPSERLERLSTSDSDDPSTTSSGSSRPTNLVRSGARGKLTTSKKKSPENVNNNGTFSKLKLSSRPVKDAVLRDTYIGNGNNLNIVDNLVDPFEGHVVISSTFTSSATETVL